MGDMALGIHHHDAVVNTVNDHLEHFQLLGQVRRLAD